MTTKKRPKHRSRRQRRRRPGHPAKRNGSRTGPLAQPRRLLRPSVEPAPGASKEAPDEGPSFLEELQALDRSLLDKLNGEHPLIFLLHVSQTYAIYDNRTLENPERIDMADRLASLAGWELASFRATGYAMSRMLGRDHERASFDKAYSRRPTEFPVWLQCLDTSEATGCWRGRREDECDEVIGVGIRFGDGQEGTLVVMTCSDTGEIGDSYLSLTPYAEAALNWTVRDRCAASLNKITSQAAYVALTRTIECSDPTNPDEHDGGADWASGRLIMEWAAMLLARTSTSRVAT